MKRKELFRFQIALLVTIVFLFILVLVAESDIVKIFGLTIFTILLVLFVENSFVLNPNKKTLFKKEEIEN